MSDYAIMDEKHNQMPHGYGFVTSFVPSMHASGVRLLSETAHSNVQSGQAREKPLLQVHIHEFLGNFLGEPSGLVWRNNVNFWLNGLIFQHV
jgi:hypothetical protein